MSETKTMTPAIALRMVAGAAAGAICGAGVMFLAKALGARTHDMPWSDVLSLYLAVLLVGAGVITAWASLDRRRLARRLEPEAEYPATSEEVTDFRLQASVLALAGVLIAAPVLTDAATRAHRPAALGVMVGVVFAFGLQTALNIRIWRRADEFNRRLLMSVAALCFCVLQGVLFLWAVGERLRLLPRLDSWEAINVAMLVYLIAGGALGFIRLRRAA